MSIRICRHTEDVDAFLVARGPSLSHTERVAHDRIALRVRFFSRKPRGLARPLGVVRASLHATVSFILLPSQSMLLQS